MKTTVPSLLILLAVFSLSGCGVAYQQERSRILSGATGAEFGPPPPSDWHDKASAFIRSRLKDPESARFEFGEPKKEALQPAFASPHATPV